MTCPTADCESTSPVTVGPKSRVYLDVAALVLLALALATMACGHFVKPHSDFFEFRETGHALLRGELPHTLKRAPVFPLIVATMGSLLGAVADTQTPPDQLAAAWLNAALLPVNVILCYLIGRHWLGGHARWCALWTALLPVGLYCTAHVLAEPLLVSTILLTLWLVQRGSRWAYVAGSLAVMTRYDAAGLLLGIAIADLIRRTPVRRVALRSAAAFLPLGLWLALTALTWQGRSEDHYLTQLLERRQSDLAWPVSAAIDCVFGPQRLTVPVWAAECEPFLRGGVRYGIGLSALLGLGMLLRRRDCAALTGFGFLAGYLLVHAFFPFRFERFGYPPAPLLILTAGVGAYSISSMLLDALPGRTARGLIQGIGAALLMLVLLGEASRSWSLIRFRDSGVVWLPAVALAGTLLVWLASWPGRARLAGWTVLALAFGVLSLVQGRLALPLLGTGLERVNVVKAARWVRDFTPPTEGVLSDSPGMLRLYAGDLPRERFVGFGEIAAQSWPAILAECRQRGISYIMWHDQIAAEQGAYYIRKWRLDRFDLLSNPDQAPGVVVVKRYEQHPTLLILRVLPE